MSDLERIMRDHKNDWAQEIARLRIALEAIRERSEKDSWAYVYAEQALKDKE